MEKHDGPVPSMIKAFGALSVLAAVLIVGNLILDLPEQFSLLFTSVLRCIFAVGLGHQWKSVEKMILNGLNAGLFAMLINSMIGILIAALCASGTMPYIMCLGLRFISPRFFNA